MNRRPFLLAWVLLVMLSSTVQAQDFFGWANSIGNSNENEISDIAVDNDGNVYIAGLLEGTIDFDPSGLTRNLTPTGSQAAYLAKYDKDGRLVWNRKLEVNSLTDIFFNGGSIVAYGTFIGSATIDTQTYTNTLSTTAKATFVAGFNLNDGSLLGGRAILSSGDQESFDVKAKGDFVYISGSFQGTIDLGSSLTTVESTQRGNAKDFYMARINNMGGIDWAKTVATNGGANRIDEIELDDDGGLYLGGILRENLDFNTGTNLAAAFDGFNQGFVTKLDTAGTFKWFRRTRRTNLIGSSFARATVNSLEIDKEGNVTALGHVIIDSSVDGFGDILTTGNATRDLLFIKYSPTGEGLELRNIGNPGTMAGVSHVIDDNGNYIILGTGQNSDNDFDPGAGVHSVAFGTGERDIFVAKYDSLFNLQWADGFTGNTVIDRATGLIEQDGFIYIGGYHQGGIDVEFGNTNTVLSSQGGRDMLLARLNNVTVFNQSLNLCDGRSFEVGNNTYNQPGTYQDIFNAQSLEDQDSVVNTTILSVLPAIALSVELTHVLCNGESTGAVTVTASDIATRNYMYSIDGNNFQASPIFTGLNAGAYTIEVVDGDGCEAMIGFEILEPNAFAGASVVVDNVCSGGADGEIMVNVTGGTGTLTYSIDGANFQASNVFSSLASGDYTVVVKDANDCTVSGQVTINEPGALVLTEDTNTSPSCVGATDGVLDVDAMGGTAPYQYSIDGTTFSNSGTFNNQAAGNYTITVMDANQCTSMSSFTIADPVPVTVAEAGILPVGCHGNATGRIEVIASGGASGYDYSIDGTNYQTSATFTGLAAGDHTFTARDANGCTGTVTITMTEPDALSIDFSLTTVSCRGDANGAIVINSTTGGTAPYEYSIDGTNFSNVESFDQLTAGSYTLTVRDANGCIITENTALRDPDDLVATIGSATDILCNGAATGAITVAASGGWEGFTYSIDGTTFQSTNTFTGLAAGSHTLIVKDQFGCTTQLTTSLSEPAALSLPFEKVDITCFGEGDGQIAGVASGGTGPYTYSLDGTNFQTGAFSGLEPGDYTLTVKDANECTAAVSVTLAEPQVLTFGSIGRTNVLCNGGADGSVTLSGLGGTAPFAFSIDGTNFQESNVFTGLQAGTYTFTLKDAHDCLATMNVTVDQPDALSISATATDLLCNGDASGVISLAASGGTDPYSYSIDGSTFQNSNEFTGLTAGNYTVILKDANECTFTTDVSIAEPEALSVSATLVDDNTINAAAMGGTGPYEYSINGTTFQTSGTFSNLSNGDYTITVRDTNGCIATASSSLIVTSIDLPGQLPVIRTYPNPVSDVLIISQVEQGDQIALVDLKGQLINQVDIKVSEKDYALRIAHIREGMFLVRMRDRKGRVKLMKKMIRRD